MIRTRTTSTSFSFKALALINGPTNSSLQSKNGSGMADVPKGDRSALQDLMAALHGYVTWLSRLKNLDALMAVKGNIQA
jgi:hypothetical protein